jgi:transcriptional antiterminator
MASGSGVRAQVSGTRGAQEYFSIAELADRWRCSRGTVYNRLRAVGAEILDFAPRGKKGKKLVGMKTVLQIERRRTRRLR